MDQLLKEFKKPNASVERVGELLNKVLPTVQPDELMRPGETTDLLEVCCYHAAYTFNGVQFEQYFSLLLNNHYLPGLESMLLREKCLPLIGTPRFFNLP